MMISFLYGLLLTTFCNYYYDADVLSLSFKHLFKGGIKENFLFKTNKLILELFL